MSVGLTVAAVTRMRTSPAAGCGSGISATPRTSGPPNSVIATARIAEMVPGRRGKASRSVRSDRGPSAAGSRVAMKRDRVAARRRRDGPGVVAARREGRARGRGAWSSGPTRLRRGCRSLAGRRPYRRRGAPRRARRRRGRSPPPAFPHRPLRRCTTRRRPDRGRSDGSCRSGCSGPLVTTTIRQPAVAQRRQARRARAGRGGTGRG